MNLTTKYKRERSLCSSLSNILWLALQLYVAARVLGCLVFMSIYICVCSDLKEIASLIETGAYAREVRRILRVVRLTIALRRKLNAAVLAAFLNFALTPGSELHGRLFSYLPKVILGAL